LLLRHSGLVAYLQHIDSLVSIVVKRQMEKYSHQMQPMQTKALDALSKPDAQHHWYRAFPKVAYKKLKLRTSNEEIHHEKNLVQP